MNKEIKINSRTLGLTYAGSFFGAGFVSGNELYEFFGSFGLKGYPGIILSILLFFIFGVFLIRIVQMSGKSAFDELIIQYDSKSLRMILGLITVFLMFGIFVVMTAGAGALLNQVFELPLYIGCLIFTLLCCVAALFGLSGAVKVFSTIVPVLVILTLLICILSLKKYGINFDIKTTNSNPLLANWVFSAITYVSYNMITLIGTMTPVGAHVKNKKTVYTGILFGCILALSIALGILISVTSVYGASDKELPMLDIAFRLNNIFGYIYALLLLMAMFGTSLSSIVAITVYFQNRFNTARKNVNPIIFIMGILTFICSLFGFGNLVNTVYPVFGYIGFAVLILIVANFAYLKIKK